jgi:capsular exopolysaccharide synthesis family protein
LGIVSEKNHGEKKMLFEKKNKATDVGRIIVGKEDKRSTEGYSRLRDNILYLNADGKNKVIQVESAMAGEGKTTTVCNLAVSLGMTNKKVIVVDLDFKRPKVHRLFNLGKENGIAEYILENKSSGEIIKNTEYDNVDVITRGAEIYNSSLVFISEKFKALIAELREKYDYVILDCAPVLLVSDYIHISKVSDGVLFVVAHAITSKTHAMDAVKELKKNGANILGSIFTMYDGKKSGYYGTGYYKKYSYSYVSEDKED